jgi:hypothetical protein
MKTLRAFVLSLLTVFSGMPFPGLVQAKPELFRLPDGVVGQVYRVNIEGILRDTYRLRLETDAGASVFHWTMASGEMPQGLTLRPNGTIHGTPRVSRETSYQFQVKVTNVGVRGMEPLQIDFAIAIAAPRIRVVKVTTPQLLPIAESSRETINDLSNQGSSRANWVLANDRLTFNDRMESRSELTRMDDAPEIKASFLRPLNSKATDPPSGALVDSSAVDSVAVATPACDSSKIPTGTAVFHLDARNGNLTDGAGHTASAHQRFGKSENVTIVVDNKNPYLYTYKYSTALQPVTDVALNAFVPLIIGNLGDLAKSPSQSAAPVTTKTAAETPPPSHALPPVPKCQPAIDLTAQLIGDLQTAIRDANYVKIALEREKVKSRRLTDDYQAARLPIFSLNQPRETLCSASIKLVNTVYSGVDTGTGIDKGSNQSPAAGVDPMALDQIRDSADALTQAAGVFNRRIAVIREAFPDCMNEVTDKGKLLREHLREASENADKLAANAENFRGVVTQIRENLALAIQGRNGAQSVLNNQFAFYEVHSEGAYEETHAGPIQLEVTPRPGVAEAVAIAGSPFKLEFTFGGAPFFSISGGLIFSPLRKQEFVRVQGFERDAQGNVLMVDGKPNLTTVVGLKENSPTRITPAIFLNGRLTDPKRNGPIDGVYMSLGITAKNDNKGTDVEFLLGPSVSMFDHNMFFTFGGYAGKQQKLTGGLFEGFAVPSTVDELPIQKNYRWHLGFAVSYRVPINK